MKGTVLLFDDDSKRGIIEDKNQNRYTFHIGEWLSEQPIIAGKKVNFEIPKEEALNITVAREHFFLRNLLREGKGLFSFVCRGKNYLKRRVLCGR